MESNTFLQDLIALTFLRKKPDFADDSVTAKHHLARSIDYVRLEERRVLNAAFSFDVLAAELTLDNFTNSDSGADDSINLLSSGDNLIFQLNDGAWSTSDPFPGFDFSLSNGDSILTVNNGANTLESLILNANTAVRFDIHFGPFDFANGNITIVETTGQFGAISELTDRPSDVIANRFSFQADALQLATNLHDFSSIDGDTRGSIQLNEANSLHIQHLRSETGNISVVAQGDIVIGNIDGRNGLAGITILDPEDTNDVLDTISLVSEAGEIVVNSPLTNFADASILLDANEGISLNETLSSEKGTVLLTVSNGDLEQTLTSAINAESLGLSVNGDVALNSRNNATELAALITGNLAYTNASDIRIGDITVGNTSIEGLTTTDLMLTVNGSLSQSASVNSTGTTTLHVADNICLHGTESETGNQFLFENDFGGPVNIEAGGFVEIVDTNDLIAGDITANNEIRLRAGNGTTAGALSITGQVSTESVNGKVLLQANNGVTQSQMTSSIATAQLLLGSVTDPGARQGDFRLNSDNAVQQLAGRVDGILEFTNRRDLELSPLSYLSSCNGTAEVFTGVQVESAIFRVTGNGDQTADLTDAVDTITVIRTTASLNVDGDIMLGDGSATLMFTEQTIDQLLTQRVSTAYVEISANENAGNENGSDIQQTQNVSLFVDSSIILADVNVGDLLFIDTIEDSSIEAGDILQTMLDDAKASLIASQNAAFVSNASVQLTNTDFQRVSVESNQTTSQLIRPFELNSNIGSTFTGSIDANVFAAGEADNFLLNGNSPVTGVTNVETQFLNGGFFAGNNDFVNSTRIGTVLVNRGDLVVVDFESMNLSVVQSENIMDSTSAITSRGDVYIETLPGQDLTVAADVSTTSALSNTTVIAGDNLSLQDGANFQRLNEAAIAGLVNALQPSQFSPDHYELNNPRSVIAAPGNIAFSDLNAQLDSAIGFQTFDLFVGNPGEQSFNVLVGWFIEGVTPSQAISASFQMMQLNNTNDQTADFLFSNFDNFGQSISAYSVVSESVIPGNDPLELTNISQFEQSFFAQRSFLLSQAFVTNDSRINLFSAAGTNDLNFSQEILPTRTVVENPAVIVVPLPKFEIPEALAAPTLATFNFANIVEQPDDRPLLTDQPPASYFQIRYTADDDGIYEEEFKWLDQNDDPDAIRSIIEEATLVDDDKLWPDTTGKDEGNWTEQIKRGKVKPGLYFIFEVQEGQLLPEPVDAPVDRTDLENLVEPASEPDSLEPPTEPGPSENPDLTQNDKPVLEKPTASQPTSNRFSNATTQAMLGSSLLLTQLVDAPSESDAKQFLKQPNCFSRAARIIRKINRG